MIRTALVIFTVALMTLTGAAFSVSTAFGAPATGTLDQTTTPESDGVAGYDSLNPSDTGVQIFTAGKSGVLTGVDIYA